MQYLPVSSWEHSTRLGTEFHEQINLKSYGLDKFLYSKISMSLQYRFIFIMVHCESSVDAIFFPKSIWPGDLPSFSVAQLLAFEELFMGLMTFQSWEKHRKLQTNFVLKSFQDFLMVISKWMAGRTLRFLGFCVFLQILSLGSGS